MSAWYLKYRPRQIAALHLASVRKTLEHLMVSGRFPQALLFAGPKGTGKTSAARIIGAVLNDPANTAAVTTLFLDPKQKNKTELKEPDNDSDQTIQISSGQSFVVTEIDAASHGLVDDVRLLKERAALPPQSGLMTVYILDEVHMMSTAAFNALLKLLEEPPAHAVFILATTELHKVPATIASRCTLVQFQKASVAEILEVYERIIKAEKLKAEPAALQLLAELADGSFRDAVKWLELSVTDGTVTETNVQSLMGGNLRGAVVGLISAVIAKDSAMVSQIFQTWRQVQADPTAVIRAVFGYLHESLMAGLKGETTAVPVAVAQFLLTQLLEAQLFLPSPIPHLALELKLLGLIAKSKAKNGGGSEGGTKATEPKASQPAAPQKTPPEKMIAQQAAPVPAKVEETTSAEMSPSPIALASPEASAQLLEKWPDFVLLMAKHNTTIAALLQQTKPKLTPTGVSIAVSYSFHRDQLKQAKFVAHYQKATQELVGQSVAIEVQLLENLNAPVDTVGQSQGVSKPSALSALASEALL
jgi:DNA polymerase-3 subunit gamma/tau